MPENYVIKFIVKWIRDFWREFFSWKSFDKAIFIISIIGLSGLWFNFKTLEDGARQGSDIAAGVTTLSRIQIFQLADRSMMVRDFRLWDAWDGADANAYEQLIKIAKDPRNYDLAELARKQTERVQRSYTDSENLVSRIRLDMGIDKNGNLISNEAISTKDLRGLLLNDDNTVKTHPRAAQLLAERGGESKVLYDLSNTFQNDPSLLTRKIALDSFVKITGCKIENGLDFTSAIGCWDKKFLSKEISNALQGGNMLSIEDVGTALYYFYSTLAQCMAALVALYGIFVVFQWQVLEQKINSTHEGLKSFFRRYIKRGGDGANVYEVDMWLEKDIPVNLRKEIAAAKENSPDLVPALCDYYLQLNEFECFKKYLSEMVKYCTVAPLACLLWSIFVLAVLPYGKEFFNFLRFPIVPLVAFLFYWQVRLILKTLMGPQPIQINNFETNISEEVRKKFSKDVVHDIIEEVLQQRKIKHKPFKAEI